MTDADDGKPEPMRCHTCKHFRVHHDMRDYDVEFQIGQCAVKMVGNDHGPEVNLVSGWNGAYVDSIDVDALWGCRSWDCPVHATTEEETE